MKKEQLQYVIAEKSNGSFSIEEHRVNNQGIYRKKTIHKGILTISEAENTVFLLEQKVSRKVIDLVKVSYKTIKK